MFNRYKFLIDTKTGPPGIKRNRDLAFVFVVDDSISPTPHHLPVTFFLIDSLPIRIGPRPSVLKISIPKSTENGNFPATCNLQPKTRNPSS